MDRLNDKVSIITGGGKGIGRAISIAFAKEGSKVVIAARDEKDGEETVQMIKNQGGDATFIKTDVTVAADVEKMVQFAIDTYGKLSVLVNNAGVFNLETPELCDLSEEIWDQLIDVNLKGTFLSCKYGLRAMKKAGGGAVINISSIAGLSKSIQPAYAASKGGVIQLTKGIAATMGDYNIRANVICPSTIETTGRTAMIKPGYYKNDVIDHTADEEKRTEHRKVIRVLPRFGVPEDIAHCAVYLASDESKYVTAAVFPVDGGTVRTRID